MDTNLVRSWEKTVEWNFVRTYLCEYDFGAPIDGDYEISDALLAKVERWQLVEFKLCKKLCSAERSKYPYTNKDRTIKVLMSQFKKLPSITKDTITKQIDVSVSLHKQKVWGGEGPVWEFCVELEKSILNKQYSHLEKSKSKFLDLFNKYSAAPLKFEKLEPHFFVYAAEKDFNSLLAYPYWTEWISKDSETLRNGMEFNADSLAKYGSKKNIFDAYVLDLAIARGYDFQEGSSDGDSGCIVLGNIAGISGSKGVALTLNHYIAKLNKPTPTPTPTPSAPPTPTPSAPIKKARPSL